MSRALQRCQSLSGPAEDATTSLTGRTFDQVENACAEIPVYGRMLKPVLPCEPWRPSTNPSKIQEIRRAFRAQIWKQHMTICQEIYREGVLSVVGVTNVDESFFNNRCKL